MIKAITPVDITDLPNYHETRIAEPAGFGFRRITLNGAILPSKGKAIRKVTDMQTKDFYRLKEVFYDVDGKKGFIARKDIGQTVSLTMGCAREHLRLKNKFNTLRDEYVDYVNQMNSHTNNLL